MADEKNDVDLDEDERVCEAIVEAVEESVDIWEQVNGAFDRRARTRYPVLVAEVRRLRAEREGAIDREVLCFEAMLGTVLQCPASEGATRDDWETETVERARMLVDGLRVELSERTAERDAALAEVARLWARGCVARMVGGDRAVGAYLTDGTKIVVRRGAGTTGPAWLEHVPQATIHTANTEREQTTDQQGPCGCTGDGHDPGCEFWQSLADPKEVPRG